LVEKSPYDCPLIILGDYNINILDDININKSKLKDFINILKSKSQFKNNNTKSGITIEPYIYKYIQQ
jgi:hypothetical protein